MANTLRDTQRSKVYKAERVLRQFAKPLPKVADVERFVKKQMARKAITNRYPRATRVTKVKDGRGRRAACAWAGHTISIPLWARNDAIVLHEMAHIIVNREFWNVDYASHGWRFASVFLDLVRFVMGRDAHDALKASFKEHGVKFNKPRAKRVYTPEQIEILRTRLAAAKEARA